MKLREFILYFVLIIELIISGCSSSLRYQEETELHITTNYDSLLFNSLKNSQALFSATGEASFYSNKFNGRKTANGEKFSNNDLTAAHIDFPFNTIVRVTNLSNQKFVIVRINDRTPSRNKRLIDLSRRAASTLGMISNGVITVQVDVLKWGE